MTDGANGSTSKPRQVPVRLTRLGVPRKPAVIETEIFCKLDDGVKRQLVGRKVRVLQTTGTIVICWDGEPRVRLTQRCIKRGCKKTHRRYLDYVKADFFWIPVEYETHGALVEKPAGAHWACADHRFAVLHG